MNTMHPPLSTMFPAGGIGDINSVAKGSGARFNSGKDPLELIPFRVMADSYRAAYPSLSGNQRAAVDALHELGLWQERRSVKHSPLLAALRLCGLKGGWQECARVFDYGRRKYAAWNWSKGMAWSAVAACAARHLVHIIEGEEIDHGAGTEEDSGSGLPHRGHMFCNVVMLLTFATTYPEGDDRPAAGMLA